jgi:hypothetical protein
MVKNVDFCEFGRILTAKKKVLIIKTNKIGMLYISDRAEKQFYAKIY